MSRRAHLTHDASRDRAWATDDLPLVSRRAARVALIALHGAALLVVLIELMFPITNDSHGIERHRALEFLGSYALYGFVACVVLVLLGRALRRAVMRNENYYGDGHS